VVPSLSITCKLAVRQNNVDVHNSQRWVRSPSITHRHLVRLKNQCPAPHAGSEVDATTTSHPVRAPGSHSAVSQTEESTPCPIFSRQPPERAWIPLRLSGARRACYPGDTRYPGRRVIENKHSNEIGRARMTHRQGECSYRRAASVRRFNVGRVPVLNNTPVRAEGPLRTSTRTEIGSRLTFRVKTHIDAQRSRRKFDVDPVRILNSPPASSVWASRRGAFRNNVAAPAMPGSTADKQCLPRHPRISIPSY